MRISLKRHGITFVELLAVLAVMSALIAVIVTRVAGGQAGSKSAACHVNKGNVEIQVELWRRNVGSLPTANLSTIGADASYFPSGLPTCPIDGSAYTIDPAGRVQGHNH